jgi:hypothetical protein
MTPEQFIQVAGSVNREGSFLAWIFCGLCVLYYSPRGVGVQVTGEKGC